MNPLYTAHALSTGDGRNGHTALPDGSLEIDLAIPKEMGGSGGGANPEQLFALGYAACFHSALKFVAGATKQNVDESAVAAAVSIGASTTGGFELAVILEVELPHLEPAEAEALVARAHEVCPYSNATRGNIDVQLRLT